MMSNKGKSKIILADYRTTHEPELCGYSEYIRRRYSILYNIRKALTTNTFKENEVLLSGELYDSAKWVADYCKSNDLEISYSKKLSA